MNWRLFIATLFLAGCGAPESDETAIHNPERGLWQDRQGAVELVLVQTFGREDGPVEEILSGPVHGAVDDDGNLYLLDRSSGAERLVAFAPDGTVRWTVDAQGEAPGELNRAMSLGLHRDRLWIGNRSGARLDAFDLAGVYQRSLTLEPIGVSFGAFISGFPSDGTMAIGLLKRDGYGARTALLSLEGDQVELLDSTSFDHTGDAEVYPGFLVGASQGVVHDRLVVAHSYRYEYTILDDSLQTARVITREGIAGWPPAQFNHTRGSTAMGTLGWNFQPLPLANGRWLGGAVRADVGSREDWIALREADAEVAYKRVVDLFSPDGRLLWTWDHAALEEAGMDRVLTTDGRDGLYAVTTDPSPSVGLFRLHLSEE